MKNKLYYALGLLVALFTVACEDLEETYDEYTGDGVIRYVGKCSDMELSSGWERLKLTWKNNIDATIKQVKVTWQAETDDEPFVRYIDRSHADPETDLWDTLYLENLKNLNYKVCISNLTADSIESLVEEKYARPYTEEHEDLRSFTRGIVNFYPLGDKIAVVLDEDNENLHEMILNYWDTEGTEHHWDIKAHMDEWSAMRRASMFLLPDGETGIDFQKALTVSRKGMLDECIDTLNFKADTLYLDEIVWSSDFTQWLTRHYGSDWQEHLKEITTVELDYDFNSFLNLFYFPNLQKVILGKNRYMDPNHAESLSKTDIYTAIMTLQFLKTTRGVTVERYNKHYLGASTGFSSELAMMIRMGEVDRDLITEKGNSNFDAMPYPALFDMSDWKVTCSDTTYNGTENSNGAGYLLDNDPATYFEPGQTSVAKVFELIIDMQQARQLHGFKVTQPDRGTIAAKDKAKELAYLLNSLKIEVSADDIDYENATYEKGGSTIGNCFVETSFIEIPEALRNRPVRYIRLTLGNRHVGKLDDTGTPVFSLRLGDFIPY